ncbi:hypothetical protein [Paenibacillus xylanexedens]|uniref:hypothetical protein n=1 Tax=Paenibacillus xylanexedens TaxID=528191 RepID=UPI0011A2EBBF|nr:hypothetical protein [Paenibacillus xylanexedens]
MVKTLDARTSQGSNGTGELNLDNFINGIPLLMAQVGLQVKNPGPWLRTFFSGTINLTAYNLPSQGSLGIEVYRESDGIQALVYFSYVIVRGNRLVSPCTLTFNGSDYNVPAPSSGQVTYTVYSVFTYNPQYSITNFRIGPESFNATIYSDD